MESSHETLEIRSAPTNNSRKTQLELLQEEVVAQEVPLRIWLELALQTCKMQQQVVVHQK